MLSKSSQENHKKCKFPEQAIINALLVGSKGVGKTTIGERVAGTLSNNILLAETYGIDFHFLTFKDKSSYISVQFWDVDFPNYECDSPNYFINNFHIKCLVSPFPNL